jgi:peptidoglycan/xylan/chitin deacetylase (PgdA/CDA1 family)
MKNILSIDLESWVHFYQGASKEKRGRLTSSDRKILDNNYIPKATKNILNLLEKYNQKATFFVLGEIYDWYPELIEEMDKRGHEIGYHTHTHVVLTDKEIMERELQQSIDFISRFNPIGFRAPRFFVTRNLMSCLKRWGFKYSSSTYDKHKICNIEGIDEIPVSTICFRGRDVCDQELPKNLTLKMLSKKIPVGSGLFIALLGLKISYVINRLNKNKLPAILFIHPWQLYIPRNLKKASFKLDVLCHNPFRFPYTRNILKPVEELMRRHKFLTFREYYYS